MNKKNLQIVICVPCFNEASRLPKFMEQIKALAQPEHPYRRSDDRKYQFCFHFLDDGSDLQQSESMKKSLEEFPKITGVELKFQRFSENRGKGAVLRDGFLLALKDQADFVGFLDGDGATNAEQLADLIEVFDKKPETDVVIGSRWMALGHKVERKFKRHLSGRIFATLLSEIFRIPIYDSQCGAKIFRAEVLSNALLASCYDDKWLFDTQLIISLFLNKKNIVECPVDWSDQPGSKVHLFRDSWRMFWGLLKFKRKISG